LCLDPVPAGPLAEPAHVSEEVKREFERLYVQMERADPLVRTPHVASCLKVLSLWEDTRWRILAVGLTS
jgi:hypothetical protein